MTVLSIGASMTFGPLSRFVIELNMPPWQSCCGTVFLRASICSVFASVDLNNKMTFSVST